MMLGALILSIACIASIALAGSLQNEIYFSVWRVVLAYVPILSFLREIDASTNVLFFAFFGLLGIVFIGWWFRPTTLDSDGKLNSVVGLCIVSSIVCTTPLSMWFVLAFVAVGMCLTYTTTGQVWLCKIRLALRKSGRA